MLCCVSVIVSCSFKKAGDMGGGVTTTSVSDLKIDPTGDSDGDGMKDTDEIAVGRNPFVAELPDLKVRFLQNYKIFNCFWLALFYFLLS